MKIAVLSQTYPPMISGAALFAQKLANYLVECGHEVLVITASDRPRPYQEIKPGLRIERRRSYPNPWRKGQRFSLLSDGYILKQLQDFNPDVIHIHDPFQLAGIYFARTYHLPLVLTVHQLPWFISAYLPASKTAQRLVETALWRFGRGIIKRCSRAVTVTKTIAEIIFEHTGILPQTISVGIDLKTFSPNLNDTLRRHSLRSRLGIPEKAPIILHVGRLDKDKRVDLAIRAAAIAMRKTAAHLLVVGDGTERAKLELLCKQQGILDQSHFTGYVTVQDGLAAFYQISNVFITASEIETQGVVLLEAAACGLPIVAVQATCLHEIVHEGINGYLLPCGDITGMAERLIELLQYPEQAHAMGLAGRKIVESHANEKTLAAYEDLLREVVKSSVGR